MEKNIQNKKGFTLIELLLYIGILSIVITSLVLFALRIITGNAKSSTQQEISSQARYISERLKYEIRNANGINSVSSNQISLIKDTPNNPTIINLSAGKVMIQQGGNAAVSLNSVDINITDLTFSNYSLADNKTKNIGFTLTLVSNFQYSLPQYIDTISLRTCAEVRSN